MFSCFICKKSLHSIPMFCKHFKVKHATYNFLEYICVERGCNRSFHLLNSFKKHLTTHETDVFLPTVETNSNVVTSNHNYSSINSSASNVNLFPTIENSSKSDPDVVFEHFNDFRLTNNHIGKFLASLYSNVQISRNVIQVIVESIIDIIEGIKNYLMNSTLDSHNVFGYIKSVFEDINTTFTNLNTEYKRIKYYTEKGSYIPPDEYVVGERLNDNRNKNTFSIIPINCTAQFIPTRHVLNIFFEMNDVRSDTLNYINEVKDCDSILTNFIQGSIWENKSKNYDKNQIILPIFLFFDDYEIGNPLGSHSSIHKLGAVYLTVPCIPLHHQASLSNIILALLFHSSDRQKLYSDHLSMS